MLSTEWKGNLSFIQVEHSHKKLPLSLFNSSSSACFNQLHFLWTTELQFVQNTLVSALLFLLSQTLQTTEIFCELQNLLQSLFIFLVLLFSCNLINWLFVNLKKGSRFILHGLQYHGSSLSEFCNSSYSFLLIPAYDLWTQRLHILQRKPGCLS